MGKLTPAEAESMLAEYAAMVRGRDDMILAALAAGVSITRITAMTGIARTTIYRAIAAPGLAALPGLTVPPVVFRAPYVA